MKVIHELIKASTLLGLATKASEVFQYISEGRKEWVMKMMMYGRLLEILMMTSTVVMNYRQDLLT